MHFHCVTSRPKIFHNCGLFDANAKILLHAEIVTKFSLSSLCLNMLCLISFFPPLCLFISTKPISPNLTHFLGKQVVRFGAILECSQVFFVVCFLLQSLILWNCNSRALPNFFFF